MNTINDTPDAAIIAFVRSLSAGQCLEIAGSLGFCADHRGPAARRFDDFQSSSAEPGETVSRFPDAEIDQHLKNSQAALRQAAGLFFELAYAANSKSDIGRWPLDVQAARHRVVGAD